MMNWLTQSSKADMYFFVEVQGVRLVAKNGRLLQSLADQKWTRPPDLRRSRQSYSSLGAIIDVFKCMAHLFDRQVDFLQHSREC